MVKYKKYAVVDTRQRNVNGCVYSSKMGKEKATNQFAIQLMKIPTAMAVSRAYNGKISAIMNHAIQPGPKVKKTMTPVILNTES
jgi:hypothetical protein